MDESFPPPPPAPNPAPQSTVSQPGAPGEGVTLAPNVAATICAAVPLVGGLVFLILEKRNAFVRFWAMQSVVLGGALLAIYIALYVLGFTLGAIPLLGLLVKGILWLVWLGLVLGMLVLTVVMIVKAFSNVEWEIPVLGKIARQQLARQRLL